MKDEDVVERVEYVARNLKNRAGVRLLLACLLAKGHQPAVDVRKPYTEIGDADAFSGRSYDERYIGPFVSRHDLPCNSTTAFLAPALRNRNATLTLHLDLVGRPKKVYDSVLMLLDAVHQGRVGAEDLLAETVRVLLVFRGERQGRIRSLLADLSTTEDAIPLSSEEIVGLVEQHMNLKGTSRLPVLVVAAAFEAAGERLQRQVRSLYAHNAADRQTGALGDVEIVLADEQAVVTAYEMKNKPITRADVDRAVQKVVKSEVRVDNYIFVTTAEIDAAVQEYARSLYKGTGGIEFVILDCIGFLRHFLHLFHRLRAAFLEAYQALLVAESQSAVSQPVKEAFLAMRRAAEEA